MKARIDILGSQEYHETLWVEESQDSEFGRKCQKEQGKITRQPVTILDFCHGGLVVGGKKIRTLGLGIIWMELEYD